MKCPRKLLLISIFLLITLTSCHKVDKTVNTYELAEVEKNLENDYMEAKDNHYINLSFDEISVIFPRGKEEIYELEIKPKYIHYRDEKMTKLIKEQVEVSKKYLGNKIKDIDFEIRLFSDGNTKVINMEKNF